MDRSQNPPVCVRCKNSRNYQRPVSRILTLWNWLKNSSKSTQLAIKFGLSAISVLSFVLSLSVHAVYGITFFYIPSVILGLGTIGCCVLLHDTKQSKAKGITMAQVNTLLRINNNTITAKQLASATNTSEETATDFLKKLVTEGKLSPDIEYETAALVYKKSVWDND
jgi:hypothetical protein